MESSSYHSSAMETSSYRPRNAGHDYYGRGTYLITLVVSGRERLLSHFVADFGHKHPESGHKHPDFGHERPALTLTPLGEFVQAAWLGTPAHQLPHGNRVAVHACVCMPDHFHGVIEVLEPMQWSLGDIIQAFKAVCTSRWQQGLGLPSSTNEGRPALQRGCPDTRHVKETAAGVLHLRGTPAAPALRRQLRRHDMPRRAPPPGHDSLRARQPAARHPTAPSAQLHAALPTCADRPAQLRSLRQPVPAQMAPQGAGDVPPPPSRHPPALRRH